VGAPAHATQRLAAGDRSIELATEPADELGSLAASFNRLGAELAESLSDLEAQRERAEQAKAEAEAASAIRDALLVRVGRRLSDTLGASRDAAREPDETTRRDGLDDAHREIAVHADALLALSSAGMTAPRWESVELVKHLRAAVTRAEPQVALSGSSIELEVENQLGRITTDAERLAAVLDEVLANAARFTRQGSIRVVAERGTDEVVVRIVDDGIGMTRGQREQVETPQAREDGAGLGLFLAARFAQHVGVSIELRGNPGEGTTVTLRAPIDGSANDATRT
jgi:signal transduction histidine kinase